MSWTYRALFMPLKLVCIREMAILAEAMRRSGEGDPTFWLDNRRFAQTAGPEIEALGFEYFYDGAIVPSATSRTPVDVGVWTRMRNLFATWGPIAAHRQVSGARRRARSVLQRVRPDVIVVTGDRHRLTQRALIAEAERAGISSIVIPLNYERPEVQHWDLMRRNAAAGLSTDSGLGRVIARAFPAQAFGEEPWRILHDPAWTTIAMAAHRVHVPRPWVTGGGRSTLVAAGGALEARHARELGVPERKIVITGQASHDELFGAMERKDTIRRSLATRFALDTQRPWIAAAMPQLAEHGYAAWDQHLREMEGFTAALRDSGGEVLMSIHPQSDPDVYEPLVGACGVRISPIPLRELIPACDIFVSAFSSTTRWAVLCGIPSVCVDYFDVMGHTYDEFPGIFTVRSREELARTVVRLVHDKDHREAAADAQRARAAEFGVLDGRATLRLLQFIGQLAGRTSLGASEAANVSRRTPGGE